MRDPATQRDRGVVVNPDLLPPLPTLFTPRRRCSRAARGSARRSRSTACASPAAGHVVRLVAPPAHRPDRAPPSRVRCRGHAAHRSRCPTMLRRRARSPPGQWQLTHALHAHRRGRATARPTPCRWCSRPRRSSPPIRRSACRRPLRRAAACRRAVAVTLRVAPAGAARAAREPDARRRRGQRRAARRAPRIPSFSIPRQLAPGAHWLRLRVDGTDSVLLDRSGAGAGVRPDQRITVPA